MSSRAAWVLVLLACNAGWALVTLSGGCRCRPEVDGAPPPAAELDPVAVPGAGAPAVPRVATPRRTPNPPLFPDEGRVAVEPPAAARPGVETTAHLRVTAGRGYEINQEFHYKLTLEPTPGVTLGKTVFTHAAHDAERFDDHELAFALPLTCAQPGDFTVHGTLDFAVCKVGSQCLAKTVRVAVQVAAR